MSSASSIASSDEADTPVVQLFSFTPFQSPSPIAGEASLLKHSMLSAKGGVTTATSVLFRPRQDPPSGGWPLLAWVHGTTTGGEKLRAPSLSSTFDGDLTADGSVSGYGEVIQALTDAGFAVVAPDLEGLGAAADVPHPYYDASSLGRSLIAAVRAAHLTDNRLDRQWAAIGHSEGGHGALVAEAYAHEASESTFVGAVAFAPFTSVTAIVNFHGDRAVREPGATLEHVVQQNFNVALIAAGIRAQDSQFDLSRIMGVDLQKIMPALISKGSVGIVTDISRAVEDRTVTNFRGCLPGWDLVPEVRDYLAKNDPALMPEFFPRRPTLILQGGQDISVPDELTTAFVANLAGRAQQVDYRLFSEADHFSILPAAMPDALAFLKQHLMGNGRAIADCHPDILQSHSARKGQFS